MQWIRAFAQRLMATCVAATRGMVTHGIAAAAIWAMTLGAGIAQQHAGHAVLALGPTDAMVLAQQATPAAPPRQAADGAVTKQGPVGPEVAHHQCDALGERGWSTVATIETVRQQDSAPRLDAASGEWFVERSTTRLPFCNYFNTLGNYSLRSYTLAPETTTERVALCRRDAQGKSVTVPPYRGQCPPG